MKSIMLIAGEASGDLLAAELVGAIRASAIKRGWEFPPEFFGAGGPHMAAAGVKLEIDLTQHAVFGITDVLKQYLKFRRLFRRLFELAVELAPEVIILVDFGGFNLRFARAIKRFVEARAGLFRNWRPKIIYYVSPQVWASREGRAYQLAQCVDLLLSILPFEKAWYAARVPHLSVEFVGHPIIDRHSSPERRERGSESQDLTGARGLAVSMWPLPVGAAVLPHPDLLPPREGKTSPSEQTAVPAPYAESRRTILPLPRGEGRGEGEGRAQSSVVVSTNSEALGRDHGDTRRLTGSPTHPLVLLLPGSRRRELEAHLPILVEAARRIQSVQPVRLRMILPSAELAEAAKRANSHWPMLEVCCHSLAESLAEAQVALACSGTVTLECALFRVPTVVVYRTSRLTYEIGKRIVAVKYIAMPNLLAGQLVFPEFIQGDATAENVAEEALNLLHHPDRVATIKSTLTKVIDSLGPPGASRRAAEAVIELLESSESPGAPSR
ncbi:MAG: hypothetical protein HY735_27645 [Verrucomicrobia bacterium]|nr:hypothetical protein [Verrucomicrobiota bacterium]